MVIQNLSISYTKLYNQELIVNAEEIAYKMNVIPPLLKEAFLHIKKAAVNSLEKSKCRVVAIL